MEISTSYRGRPAGIEGPEEDIALAVRRSLRSRLFGVLCTAFNGPMLCLLVDARGVAC